MTYHLKDVRVSRRTAISAANWCHIALRPNNFPEIDLFKNAFKMQEETSKPGEKPVEASMDWKPDA